ncbi:MAG: hypothetical protein LBC37_01880 [Zoogloeaceae bacterium]|nr:hypothetical protein [Zoogloeaceae bacterium]
MKNEMERKALVKALEQGLACCRDREEESQRMTLGKRPEGTHRVWSFMANSG